MRSIEKARTRPNCPSSSGARSFTCTGGGHAGCAPGGSAKCSRCTSSASFARSAATSISRLSSSHKCVSKVAAIGPPLSPRRPLISARRVGAATQRPSKHFDHTPGAHSECASHAAPSLACRQCPSAHLIPSGQLSPSHLLRTQRQTRECRGREQDSDGPAGHLPSSNASSNAASQIIPAPVHVSAQLARPEDGLNAAVHACAGASQSSDGRRGPACRSPHALSALTAGLAAVVWPPHVAKSMGTMVSSALISMWALQNIYFEAGTCKH